MGGPATSCDTETPVHKPRLFPDLKPDVKSEAQLSTTSPGDTGIQDAGTDGEKEVGGPHHVGGAFPKCRSGLSVPLGAPMKRCPIPLCPLKAGHGGDVWRMGGTQHF